MKYIGIIQLVTQNQSDLAKISLEMIIDGLLVKESISDQAHILAFAPGLIFK